MRRARSSASLSPHEHEQEHGGGGVGVIVFAVVVDNERAGGDEASTSRDTTDEAAGVGASTSFCNDPTRSARPPPATTAEQPDSRTGNGSVGRTEDGRRDEGRRGAPLLDRFASTSPYNPSCNCLARIRERSRDNYLIL